jgi:hypothetical protein
MDLCWLRHFFTTFDSVVFPITPQSIRDVKHIPYEVDLLLPAPHPRTIFDAQIGTGMREFRPTPTGIKSPPSFPSAVL